MKGSANNMLEAEAQVTNTASRRIGALIAAPFVRAWRAVAGVRPPLTRALTRTPRPVDLRDGELDEPWTADLESLRQATHLTDADRVPANVTRFPR